MATRLGAVTTPPPSSLHTPKTPRLGGLEDDYEPYSPRKSTRLSECSHGSRSTNTPPPRSTSRNLRNTSTSPPSKETTGSSVDAPLSSVTAPKKRTRLSSFQDTTGRKVSDAVTHNTTAFSAASLGLSPPKHDTKALEESSTTVHKNGMLPTPAKTPVKRPEKKSTHITSIARNLFPVHPPADEEVMPTPKKGRKKCSGLSLDNCKDLERSTPIQIFTDSHDRVPEVDLRLENPFYGESSNIPPEPSKRSSKRRRINIPGEGFQTVEELEQRDDGLVYVFRGKKTFLKFCDIEAYESDEEDDEGAKNVEFDESLPANLRRPLTRSSLKPRLLFPTTQQVVVQGQKTQSNCTDDEEADTDIEEPVAATLQEQMGEASTPKAPRFVPASPPTTVRTTRSRKLDLSTAARALTSEDETGLTSPIIRSSASRGKVSPFDSWQRVKAKPVQRGHKRDGEPISRRGGQKKFRP